MLIGKLSVEVRGVAEVVYGLRRHGCTERRHRDLCTVLTARLGRCTYKVGPIVLLATLVHLSTVFLIS